MKQRRSDARMTALLLLAATLFAMGACSFPGSDEGSLLLSIQMPVARTIMPDFDMTPASYLISGTGPGGRTFSAVSAGPSVSRSSLKSGTWVVTVYANNSTGSLGGQGSGSAVVSGSRTANCAVTVSPISGNGRLAIAVTWNAAAAPGAVIMGQLLPPGGAPVPLRFTTDAGTAQSSTDGIPAGYYTLRLELLSNGENVMGGVDVARIVQEQTTSGSYDFTQAAASGGVVSVGVETVDTAPFSVTLAGAVSVLTLGETMTVVAGVGDAVGDIAGDVTYDWYLDGVSLAPGSTPGSSRTLGAALAAGAYRLDVVARSRDGLRAGAATWIFTIQ
jgi:hypothetical protein